ncbi:hypothetical protein ACT7C1_10710 [Bacillus paranthracis]
MPNLLPNFKISENMDKIPKSSVMLKILRIIPACTFVAIIVHFFIPNLWYIIISIFTIIVINQIFNGLFSKYILNEETLQIKTYSFSTKLFITNKSKIEELKIKETFFTT